MPQLLSCEYGLSQHSSPFRAVPSRVCVQDRLPTESPVCHRTNTLFLHHAGVEVSEAVYLQDRAYSIRGCSLCAASDISPEIPLVSYSLLQTRLNGATPYASGRCL